MDMESDMGDGDMDMLNSGKTSNHYPSSSQTVRKRISGCEGSRMDASRELEKGAERDESAQGQ